MIAILALIAMAVFIGLQYVNVMTEGFTKPMKH